MTLQCFWQNGKERKRIYYGGRNILIPFMLLKILTLDLTFKPTHQNTEMYLMYALTLLYSMDSKY